MAVIKTDVPPEVKKEFKETAKNNKKYESEALRQAIQMYLDVKRVRK